MADFDPEKLRGLAADTEARKKAFATVEQRIRDGGGSDQDVQKHIGEFAKAIGEQHKFAQEINPQVLESRLGAPVTNESKPSFLQRVDMGRTEVNDFTDRTVRANKALDSMPEGTDYQVVEDATGKQRHFFKKPNDQGFSELNINEEGIPELLGSFANLQTVGEVGASALSGGTAGILAKAARTGLGAAFGSAADDAVEQARGYGTKDLGQVGTDALVAGGFGAGFEALPSTLTKLTNPLIGRGPANAAGDLKREVLDITRSSDNLQDPGAGQGSPGVLPILRQRAAQFGPDIAIEEAEQGRSLGEELKSLIRSDNPVGPETFSTLSDAELAEASRTALGTLRDDFTERLGASRPEGQSLNTRGANAVRKGVFESKASGTVRGIKSFREISKEKVDRAYAKVAEIADQEDFVIDIEGAQSAIKQLRQRSVVPGRDAPTDVSSTFSPKMVALLDKVEGLQPKLKQNAPIEVNGEVVPQKPFEAIRTVQKELGDFFGSDLEIGEADQAAARLLRGELSNSLGNIIGGSGNMQRALKKANIDSAFQHEILERTDLLKIAETDNPTKVLDAFYNGSIGGPDAKLLKRIMPKERLDDFKVAMQADLLENPGRIEAALSNLRRDGVGRSLLGEHNMDLLAAYSTAWKKMDKNAYKQLLEVPQEFQTRALGLLEKGTPAEIGTVLGGMSADNVQKTQQVILTEMLNKAKTSSIIGDTLDPRVLARELDKVLQDEAALSKLQVVFKDSPGVIKTLSDTKKVAEFFSLESASNSGAGMAAGAAGGQIAHGVTHPANAAGALVSAGLSSRLGALMTWAPFRNYFNSTKAPLQGNTFRPATVMLLELGKQSAAQQKRREEAHRENQ